ncbi:hypothetical protein [Streptomyces sp. TP-A0875]|uniref:hypothetical protein n=1 Tax=Streptomyces sp. TP-A0875 TaxID=552354 RepID=UPI0006B6460B|nr:hypothetical protein [Streptomyces sp. TP-A0875]
MPEQPAPPNLADATAQLHTALRQFAAAYVAAAAPALRAISELAARVRAAEQARADEYALAPPPADDRPAWQSPYGPPTRRH